MNPFKWVWNIALLHEKTTSVFLGLLFFGFSALLWSNTYVGSFDAYVMEKPALKLSNIGTGIVFGSGITKDGKPYRELQGRLDASAHLLEEGVVGVLILSGDNRFENYNEPQAMEDYLVNIKHVGKDRLQKDFAGRSTYETCERANKVFGVEKAVLISAPSHLPRAIFTCRSFGIESYGFAAGADASNAFRRELLARVKATFNVYILGEKTVLGPEIKPN